MKNFFDDKSTGQEHVVLIAGDLSGPARTAAFAYATKGNHIVVASGSDAAGFKLTNELRARHVDAEFMHAEANSGAEIQAVVDRTVARYGHLDVQYLQ